MVVDHLVQYSMMFIGRPYIWGGDDPMRGFDCSGFVQELLAAAGMDPKGDQTAHELMEYFEKHGKVSRPQAGALIFFGSKNHATHVAFCIDNELMIEAGGGGSRTLTIQDAIAQNAYIRVRPVKNRTDFIGCLMPSYPSA